MTHWKAPKGTKVVFSIEACDGPYHASIVPPGGMTVPKYEKLRAAFLKQHGLPPKDIGHFNRSVDDPRWPELLDAIEESCKRRELRLKSLWLEEPKVSKEDPHAWFRILSGSYSFRSPSRTPEGLHFSYRTNQHLASQRFRDVVTEAKLIGLHWLPLEDSSPKDPMAWYQVYADQPLGRGLDHPLVDAIKVAAKRPSGSPYGWSSAGLQPGRRWGQNAAWRSMMCEGVAFDPPIIDRLIQSCPEYFRVQGPQRFAREFLPEVDFAYNSWGANPPNAGNPRFNFDLLCNARAREVLLEAGLVKPSHFEAVATVPEAEAGSAILDRVIKEPLPLPDFTPKEHAAEEARRLKVLSTRVAKPKAATLKTIAQAQKALQARIAKKQWTPASETKEFQKILKAKSWNKTPKAWKTLAPLLPLAIDSRTDENEDGIEWEMRAPHWNTWMGFDDEAAPEDAPSRKDLILAETPYGDWYSIRATDPKLPNDAAVVHWDHETTCKHDEWSNVLAFVAFLVEELDKIAAQGE